MNYVFTDGNWAEWSQWSTCSVTCGAGNQTKTRTCTNPTPANNGINCSTTNFDYATQICTENPCPVGNALFNCLRVNLKLKKLMN